MRAMAATIEDLMTPLPAGNREPESRNTLPCTVEPAPMFAGSLPGSVCLPASPSPSTLKLLQPSPGVGFLTIDNPLSRKGGTGVAREAQHNGAPTAMSVCSSLQLRGQG